MADLDDFGKPDTEGFSTLLSEPLVRYEGMVFRKRAFDKSRIESSLVNRSPEEVQRQYNHTHMFLYAEDVEIQREWARELERNWRERIDAEFPGLKVGTDRQDDGQEVIATFWVLGVD